MAGIEDYLIPGILGLIMLIAILWFAFKHKFTLKPANPTPAETTPSAVGTQPASMTAVPRTAATLSPSPVSQAMSKQDQAWDQKATQPDPFSAEPANETQAKAKLVMALLPYVRQYRSQGFSDEQIVDLLQRNGWPQNLIHIALEQA